MPQTAATPPWAPPEHHQCRHRHESGIRCNGTTETGRKFCHPHQRYDDANALYPANVPLLEDAAAIRLVISQTVQQLAIGAIPHGNGRSMLYGCRMAMDLLVYELATQKFAAQQKKAECAAMAALPVASPTETDAQAAAPLQLAAGQAEASHDQCQPEATDEDALAEEDQCECAGESARASMERGGLGAPRFPDLF